MYEDGTDAALNARLYLNPCPTLRQEAMLTQISLLCLESRIENKIYLQHSMAIAGVITEASNWLTY